MTELNAVNTELDNNVDNFLVSTPLAWGLDPQNPLVTSLGIVGGSYATPTYVKTELAFKADKTYTDTQLLAKAKMTDVYLKTETYSIGETVNAI